MMNDLSLAFRWKTLGKEIVNLSLKVRTRVIININCKRLVTREKRKVVWK